MRYQFGNRAPIIDVARHQAKGQQLTPVVDDQVQLEAITSADRGHAAYDTSSKLLVLADTITVADRKRSGFDDAATAAQLRVQIGHQRIEDHWHQLHEALIAHQDGKLTAQMALV